jgi:hypothetical protein
LNSALFSPKESVITGGIVYLLKIKLVMCTCLKVPIKPFVPDEYFSDLKANLYHVTAVLYDWKKTDNTEAWYIPCAWT